MNLESKLNLVKDWIADNSDIRAALLTSSFVNPLAPIDGYSDLDIELVFSEPAKYTSNFDWINQFGEPLNFHHANASEFGGVNEIVMIQFKDGDKIDFKIYESDKFIQAVSAEKLPKDWDLGYRVLCDKDGLTLGLKQPTYNSTIIKKPEAELFLDVVRNFWWDVTYLPKCLAREDLFYFNHIFEHIIRAEYFERMIEWYIGSKNNWEVTSNKHGRLFKKYLSPGEWKRVKSTFSGSDMKQNQDTSLNMLSVFSDFSRAVAGEIGVCIDEALISDTIIFFHDFNVRHKRLNS